jgi:hypothetical protein
MMMFAVSWQRWERKKAWRASNQRKGVEEAVIKEAVAKAVSAMRAQGKLRPLEDEESDGEEVKSKRRSVASSDADPMGVRLGSE